MKKVVKSNYRNFTLLIIRQFFTVASLLIILTFMFTPILSVCRGSIHGQSDKAFAASSLTTGVEIPDHGNTFADFNAYIKAVFAFSLKLGVALTALMLIFAGYKYMTSQGNPTALNEAKDIMIGSLSGFIMLLLVYLILNVYNLETP